MPLHVLQRPLPRPPTRHRGKHTHRWPQTPGGRARRLNRRQPDGTHARTRRRAWVPPFMGGEYEYWLTAEPGDIPRVVAALDGAEGDDVLPLLQANGEMIYHAGEQTWLK